MLLRTIVAHIYPPFVFLFWITFFLILTKVLFYYKRQTMHITAEMHGTRLVVSIIGGLFSIFLGFVTFISWSNYKEQLVWLHKKSHKYIQLGRIVEDFHLLFFKILINYLMHMFYRFSMMNGFQCKREKHHQKLKRQVMHSIQSS